MRPWVLKRRAMTRSSFTGKVKARVSRATTPAEYTYQASDSPRQDMSWGKPESISYVVIHDIGISPKHTHNQKKEGSREEETFQHIIIALKHSWPMGKLVAVSLCSLLSHSIFVMHCSVWSGCTIYSSSTSLLCNTAATSPPYSLANSTLQQKDGGRGGWQGSGDTGSCVNYHNVSFIFQ